MIAALSEAVERVSVALWVLRGGAVCYHVQLKGDLNSPAEVRGNESRKVLIARSSGVKR